MSAATTPEMICQELVEVITSYLEGAMAAGDVVRFEYHLRGCDGCRAYIEQMRETIAALGHLPPESLSRRAEEKLLAAFDGWRQARDDAASV
jgi:anti-sigma factor RsiW